MISLSTLLIRQAGLQQAGLLVGAVHTLGAFGGGARVKGVSGKLCRARVGWRGESEGEQLQGRAGLAGPTFSFCPALLGQVFGEGGVPLGM